ncbi:MAG TPA: tRNA adenosine(34) deaminase TadA [Myxococcales bacterium]|nr:tRNA adenosine(34) deaminase TadA [Myxococcales bacterium]
MREKAPGLAPDGHEARSDEAMMRRALGMAERAARRGEVPVGAVVTRGQEIIARASNRRESAKDATAHAELLALRSACSRLAAWRLTGLTLYVTLEPCPMCAGALVNARVARVVFGAPDPKAGAAGSLFDIPRDRRLNHRLEVVSGVLAEECGEILRHFFRERRRRSEGT